MPDQVIPVPTICQSDKLSSHRKHERDKNARTTNNFNRRPAWMFCRLTSRFDRRHRSSSRMIRSSRWAITLTEESIQQRRFGSIDFTCNPKCNLVPILGNHDEMMLHARDGKSDFQFWLNCGGDSALDSYGSTSQLSLIPQSHFRFLESCHSYYETDTHIFVHANYKPDVPLEQIDGHTLRWLSLRDYVPPKPHCSGKTFVVGHTPQNEVLDLGYLICIDTNCCSGGWLTAMDVNTKQLWQVNERGEIRKS